jgi:hypothetical protein
MHGAFKWMESSIAAEAAYISLSCGRIIVDEPRARPADLLGEEVLEGSAPFGHRGFPQ